MDERSKRAQMERKRRIRRKKQRRRILISALVEVLILAVLALAFCWDRGLSAKVSGVLGIFDRPPATELDVSGVNSSNVLLMDVKSGKVIGNLNGEERIYPASMTKIMTAIVALEAFSDLDHEITLSENIFYALDGQDATQAGFQPGESVRVRDLVYGVMLPSGAECCLALADEASGSEEAFVEKMNKKAKSIGMKDTHFMDCTGLHDPEHYSTAYDIALLLKYALHNDTFREVAESHFHSTPATNVHPDGITYYSTMFKNMSDTSVTGGEILGGKTGYTSEAGHCLASFAQIYGREYILVTAGAAADATGVPHILDAKPTGRSGGTEIRNDKSSEEVNALFLCCVSSQAGVISPFAGLPQYLLSSTAGRSQCVRFCRKRISQPFPRFGHRLDKCQVQ